MSTIKPVTIPHEVADAIETLRRDSASDPAFDNEGIAHAYVTESYVGPIALNLRKIPFDTLMRALLDGYERELTEEEAQEQRFAVVRQYYRQQRDAWFNGGNHHTAPYAIEQCLTLAGIAIPGVNAPEETEVTANV